MRMLLIICLATALAGCSPLGARPTPQIFASGLDQPRGMAFEAGSLYIAEAGSFRQADADGLPVLANHSGRIRRIAPDGGSSIVASGLPFAHYASPGSDVGVNDLLFHNGQLYALLGEGFDPQSASVVRIAPGRPPEPVASVLNFAMRGNLLGQMVGTSGVQANPYSMVLAPDGTGLLLSDGASGRVLRASFEGAIAVVASVDGMPPLTGMSYGPDGRLYVTMFSLLPHRPGSGAIYALDAAGELERTVDGLTMPIDVQFDAGGAMYILEFGDASTSNPYLAASGRLLRVGPDGGRVVLLNGLAHPTAMRFGPRGDLFIAVHGAFATAGEGQILRLTCRDLAASPSACA